MWDTKLAHREPASFTAVAQVFIDLQLWLLMLINRVKSLMWNEQMLDLRVDAVLLHRKGPVSEHQCSKRLSRLLCSQIQMK